jgi:uncharacterized membrane-anchored protein YitT (DUF2179 family)
VLDAIVVQGREAVPAPILGLPPTPTTIPAASATPTAPAPDLTGYLVFGGLVSGLGLAIAYLRFKR